MSVPPVRTCPYSKGLRRRTVWRLWPESAWKEIIDAHNHGRDYFKIIRKWNLALYGKP